MKRLATVASLASVALLALPAVASAKGPIEEATACGADGCEAVVLPPEAGKPDGMMLLFGTSPTTQPPPGPWYRLEVSMGPEQLALYYAAGKVTEGSSGAWSAVGEPLRSAFERATAGLAPHPYEIRSAIVGGEGASNPAAFAALFGDLRESPQSGQIGRHQDRWLTVQLLGPEPTPWTSVTLFYDPPTGTVATPFTGSQWFVVPASVRAEVDRITGPVRAAPATGDSSRRPLWTALAVLLTSAALVSVWLQRRSRVRTARIA